MQVPFLDLNAQYEAVRNEVIRAITDVCETQLFALGPAVTQFEQKIARYLGSKFAVGLSSGSDALLVSLMAIDIKPRDEVITTPFTFFATAGSIARLGAKPVFVDIDPDSFNIDSERIEEKISDKTRAIIPVHLFGQAAQMKPVLEIAKRRNLAVIEDAAQAIGAEQNGVKCGSLGTLGCFSFYPTKNLSAFGDAGLLTTNEPRIAEKVKMLRNHGQNAQYRFELIGGNFRLDSIQAAVLNVKLKYLDTWNKKRAEIARLYDEFFAGTPVISPKIDPNNLSIYHQYTVKVPERDRLQKYLTEKQIASAVFYPKPLHLQKCFDYLGCKKGDFPVAEHLAEQVLSLPIYPELKKEQIEYVANNIRRFYQKN